MTLLTTALAWLGRWGTQAFIASVLVGLAIPPLASAARPLLAPIVFAFLTLMFARAETQALRALAARPAPLILTCLWLVVVPPLLFALVLGAIGRAQVEPGLLLALALQAAAPPLTSAPAIAMLLGLRPTLILAAVLVTTLASAFVSPVTADWVAGAAVPLDVAVLVRRLAWLIGGALAAGLALRVAMGEQRLKAQAGALNGAGVLMYVIFGVAAMDGATAATLADPWRSLWFTLLSFAIAAAGFATSEIGLRFLGSRDRLVIGYATGMRNAALLVAALGALTPPTTYLYFALSQMPIYFLPQIMRGLLRSR